MVHAEHAQSIVGPTQPKRHPAAAGGVCSNFGASDEGGKSSQTGGKGRAAEGTNRRREPETGKANNPETPDSTKGVPVQLAKVRLGGEYQDQTILLETYDTFSDLSSKKRCSMCCLPVYVRVS